MTKKEISAIADEVVKIYFNENVSVKEAIELCRGEEGEGCEPKMDRRTIS